MDDNKLGAVPFPNRRKSDKLKDELSFNRPEHPNGCLLRNEHNMLQDQVESIFNFFRETDNKHEVQMDKLEKKIETVDEKVDGLKEELPIIIRSSMEDVFKNSVWFGIKKILKVVAGVLLLAVATAFVASIIPSFSDFLESFIANLGGK